MLFFLFGKLLYHKMAEVARKNFAAIIIAADIEDLQKRLDKIWKLSRQSLAQLAAFFM